MSSVDEFKAAGNAAFSSGNMTKAIEQFTLAISLGTTDNSSKDVMKVLYSNRSAAYHKLAKFDDALNDAKKCVSLDGQWAKGHSRAGAAYYSLRKWTDAYNSYNAVLRIDANDSNATEMRDKAMNCIANANASSNSYNSSSSSQPPVSGLLGSIRTYSQYTTLIAFIAYLIPLGTISRIAYKAVALSSIASTGITLFSSLGMPKFTADYAQRLMISPGGTTLFLSILVLASRAYVLAAIPLILPIASDCLVTYIRKVIPPGAAFDTSSLPAMVRPYVANYLPQMQQVMSELSTPGGTRRITDAAEKMAAKCEIYQGIFLVIELVLPTRNFMLIYLWWQYLMMRYSLEKAAGRHGVVKQSFFEVDAQISGYLAYPIVPAVVRQGYGTLKTFMAGQVEQALGGGGQQAAGGGGMLGRLAGMAQKCTIM